MTRNAPKWSAAPAKARRALRAVRCARTCPACFWFFANSWNDIFRNGILDHAVKELCRVYVSRSVICEFCGNQRSVKGAGEGLKETHYDDLINFEKSVKYDDRQKAALAYAEAITWRLDTDDAFWERMYKHFNEA